MLNYLDFLKKYSCLIGNKIVEQGVPAIRKTKLARKVIRRKAHFMGTVKRPKSFLGKSLYAANKGK